MSSIEITVPDDLKHFVETRATSRGFDSPGEYVLALVEADRARAVRSEVEAMLLEAVRSPSSPLGAEDFDEIRRRGQAMIERRRGA
jgi:antitoxin ParD1/3/4